MENHENSEVRNTLFIAGGIALMAFGAGLIMAHPAIRKSVVAAVTPLLPEFQGPLQAGAAKVLPDIERYLKLRAM